MRLKTFSKPFRPSSRLDPCSLCFYFCDFSLVCVCVFAGLMLAHDCEDSTPSSQKKGRKATRDCAALNIAPYREERSSQVLSTPLPATTTPLSDSSSPNRSRSLALSLSLALSPTLCLPLATREFACPPSPSREARFLEIFLTAYLQASTSPLASFTPPLFLALAAASRSDRSFSASRSLCNEL